MLGSYNSWLVALSVVIACFASYIALSLAQHDGALSGLNRRLQLSGAALALGSGIWAMHFCGILAWHLPIQLRYSVPITMASWGVAVLASAFSLSVASSRSYNDETQNNIGLLLCGLVMGAGIALTHYSGMAAIMVTPAIRYDTPQVLLSLLIAVAGSCIACWYFFHLHQRQSSARKCFAALLLGAAISGMHYTGMVAAQLPLNAMSLSTSLSVSSATMVPLLGASGLLLLALALGSIFSNTRFSAWQLMLLLGGAEWVNMITLNHIGWISHHYTLSSFLDTAMLVLFMTPVFWRLQQDSRELVREKERSQIILTSIGDAVIVVNNKDEIEFLNPLAEEMVGWRLSEAKGLPLANVFHLINSNTGEPVEDPTPRVLRDGFVADVTRGTLLVRKDGREYAIEDSAAPILNEHREVSGVVMVFRDIGNLLLQEEKLRASDERWQFALEGNNDAVWDWNIQTGRMFFSPAYHRMYGFEQGELVGNRLESIEKLHPDDVHHALGTVNNYLEGKAPVYATEYRMRCKDGSWKWVLSRGKLIERDKQGNPLRMIGTHTDISVYKAQQSELRLADAVFEQNAESIMITNAADNTITRVNPAFTRITGYSAEEAIGKNPRFLHSDRHDEEFFHAMRGTLRKHGQWRGEIWNKRKNGEIYPEELTISAVKNPQGEVQYYVGISTDISKDKEAESRIHDLAYYDTLTGLPNRLLLDDRLKVALANAARNDMHVALLFLDLDHFKEVNDTLGHTAGDQLLVNTAERILACVREGDTVARQGGDEFVLLLPDLDNTGDAIYAASTVAEKIRDVLNQPFNLNGFEASVTPSMGIAIFPSDAENMENLIRNADTAMYHAKNSGRNNFQFYASDMSSGALSRLSVDNALRHAIERDELSLYYQPQVDKNGRLLSVEALLRWDNPTLGSVSPMEFIPLAEENGQILPIGQWVLETACAQKKAWRLAGLGPTILRIAVNISQRQFAQNGFVENLMQTLDKYDVSSSEIELEMTEGILMHNTSDTLKKLDELKVLGFKISVDDFGTGYSSLAYIKHFPIDVLKIDQSFVRDIGSDSDDMAISRAIISMAKNLNLTVIAEGVETIEQLDFLHKNGCDAYQGFHFNPALPADAITTLLKAINSNTK